MWMNSFVWWFGRMSGPAAGVGSATTQIRSVDG